jgi:8-oxo-dGTP pyrophosphatase MutT (NUDIX family)
MRLFINNTCLRISSKALPEQFPQHLPVSGLGPAALTGKCILLNTGPDDFRRILDRISRNQLQGLDELICLCKESSKLKELVKKEFRVIKAAGGLVRKNQDFLLIHRLGNWDLPKGKLEKGEKMKEAAVREVEEECGIRVERKEKICNTWHSYNLDGRKILKKTAWYLMECLDDRKMKPQEEEGIDEICWASPDEARKKLKSSYRSIQAVFDCYLEKHTQPDLRLNPK